MARAIWKGHISFGLVNVPVNLYSAEQRTDLQLHLIDSRDMARVRYERVNAETGEEVPWGDIVRGYEYQDGSYVILSDEELKRAAPEATRRIEIESFVSIDEIDPRYFDKPYYLEPGNGGEKGYVLLRETLRETGRVGIATVVIRTRQYLAAMLPMDDVLVLDLLRYAQEIRSTKGLNLPSGKAKGQAVSKQEMDIARTLVESMAAEWEPEKHHDEYRQSLHEWVRKKVESGRTEEVLEGTEEEEAEAPAPINFMELLKKSVQQQGGGRASAPAGKSGAAKAPRAGKKKKKTATRRRKAG